MVVAHATVLPLTTSPAVSLLSGGTRTHGYLKQGDDFSLIDFPGAIRTNAAAINEQGDIAGQYISATAGFTDIS